MFPKLLQRLFANEGAGPKLRTDILPLDNKTLGVNGEGAVAVQLSDAVDSASSTTAASSNAVKTVWDKANSAAESASAAQSAATAAKTAADTAQGTADAAKTAAAAAQAKANSAYTEATKTASTSAAGRVQLSDAVNSSVSTTAATSKAVKTAYDKANSAATAANAAQSAATAAKTAAATAQTKADSAYTEATKEASTTHPGRVQLSNSLTSTSQTTAATSSAVKALNDKIINSASGKAYITETWHSGANWYRKWSDGWIEQGGVGSKGGLEQQKVTFFVPFSNTNYSIQVTAQAISNQYGAQGTGVGVPKTTTTAYMITTQYATEPYWYAYGY